ncbi:MAG: CSLREA domain-containing protein [Chloroflexi bacterium]|nr:CSLREA domain-containing protein [Chloroflexota bacterium]
MGAAGCSGAGLRVLAGTHPASADTAYTVNTAADAVDATIGDACLTAAGKCSLRAAIQEANANPDLTVITLKEKTHKITILGMDEDAGATGDFDLSSPITIQGVTAATSIVDANFIDRAFDLHADAALTLANATVRNGFTAGQGGAIAAEVAGTSVTATNVVFQGNNSRGRAARPARSMVGHWVIQRSTFVDNLTSAGRRALFLRSGGAIFDSLFDDNSAEYGGAITTYSLDLRDRGYPF